MVYQQKKREELVVKTKLQQELDKIFSDFPQYWDNGVLLKNKVIEDLRYYKVDLIKSLLENDLLKSTYAINVGDNFIFKIDEFIDMLRYKNYWESSYTKFSNEIGLTGEGKYLKYSTDIVLDFPHKDCVLEGGMSSEEKGKKEIYYHNILAKEEVDLLTTPKVLHNVRKVEMEGESDVQTFSNLNNLILKGNNLIALHSLKNP
jgi:adenine-specific DNA-methyltransferase